MRSFRMPWRAGVFAGALALAALIVGCGGSSSAGGGTTTPAVKAPVANAGGPYSGKVGVAVSFSGSGSSDPQGQTLTYAWNFGDSSTGTGVSPTHSYSAVGTYTVLLTVTDTSNLAATATATATITAAADFSLAAGPQSVALAAGTSEVFDVLATALNGFSGTVTGTLSGLPSGVTAGASSYTLTPGLVTQVTLTAASTVSASISTVTMTGVSGSLSHSAGVVVTAGTEPDYYIATSGPAISLVAGSSQSFYVTAYATNGFTGTVTGTVTGLPAGVTASPASFALPLGTGILVTLTAGSGATAGNTVATVGSSSGTTVHNLPMELNFGTEAQDFVMATPVSLTIVPSGTTAFDVDTGGVNGFAGTVAVAVTGLPTGVTTTNPSYSVSLAPSGTPSITINLAGAATLAGGTSSFTVTATAASPSGGTLTHSNTVVLTESPGTTETATVTTSSPGTAFPSYFVGFSIPSGTLQQFTGTGTTTWPSFINLLGNLKTYVGSPMIRTTMASTTITQLAALTTGATFTVGGVTTSPHYFITTGSAFTLANDALDVQQTISEVGSANVLGFELDNEPDLYVSNGYRAVGWTYADYLNETASFQTTFAPDVTAPKYVVTAAAGRTWDIGIPTLQAQMSGQISAFTAHEYALTACSNVPTIAQLMQDKESHNYYARFAGLVQTWGTIPVRVGEMNSVSCEGYAGVSNTLAASLWLVDTAFEAKGAGTVGFNIHSNGDSSGADPYDIGFNSSTGSLSVYAPFYGVLFFAEAIQNGAKPLPVTITQASGNVKVWATVDASNTLRVVVLEKDTDGLTNSKTVKLTLGSYTKAGTLTTMTASSLSATSGITIAGQTFDGTTNGLLTGAATSSSVTGVSGVYTITVADGTAAMLTVPQ